MNLIFVHVVEGTPTLTVRYMYHNSNSSYSEIHRLSVAFLSFYGGWGGGKCGGGGSLCLLFFSCDHYFHIDFQNKKRKQLNLVLVLWLRKTCLKNRRIRARSDEQEFLPIYLQMLHFIQFTLTIFMTSQRFLNIDRHFSLLNYGIYSE